MLTQAWSEERQFVLQYSAAAPRVQPEGVERSHLHAPIRALSDFHHS